MTATEERKLIPIMQYFIDNGFDHTVEEICTAVGITKKTLFNRYGSKEKLEGLVVDFFLLQFTRKMEQKSFYCNNAVETLVFLIDELHTEKQITGEMFTKVMQKSPVSKENLKLHLLFYIYITKGQQEGLFNADLCISLYADLFFNAIFFSFSQNSFCNDIIQYVMGPLLTEAGKNALDSLDVENLIFGKSTLPPIEDLTNDNQ